MRSATTSTPTSRRTLAKSSWVMGLGDSMDSTAVAMAWASGRPTGIDRVRWGISISSNLSTGDGDGSSKVTEYRRINTNVGASTSLDTETAAGDGGTSSVVVDLSWLTFIDSTGLGALVAARNEAKTTGAALRLVCKSDRVLKVFRITGLHSVFDIYPTLAVATAPSQIE